MAIHKAGWCWWFSHWPLSPSGIISTSGIYPGSVPGRFFLHCCCWQVLFLSPHLNPHAWSNRDASTSTVQTSEIYVIVEQRCTRCHARVPSFEGFASAPLGVELDSSQKLVQHAERVYQTVVVTRVMPLANLTQMTDANAELHAGLKSEHRPQYVLPCQIRFFPALKECCSQEKPVAKMPAPTRIRQCENHRSGLRPRIEPAH